MSDDLFLRTKFTRLENGLILTTLREVPRTFRRYGLQPAGVGVDEKVSEAEFLRQFDTQFIHFVLDKIGVSEENLWFAWTLSSQRATYHSYYKRRMIPSRAKVKSSAGKLASAALALANQMHHIFDQQILLPSLERRYGAYLNVYKILSAKPQANSIKLENALGEVPMKVTSSKESPPKHRHSLDWLATMDELVFLAHAADDIAKGIQPRRGRQTNSDHNLTAVCLIADAWVCARRGVLSSAEGSKFCHFVDQIGATFGPFPRNVKDALRYWKSMQKNGSRTPEMYGSPLYLNSLELGEDTVRSFIDASGTALSFRARKLGISYVKGFSAANAGISKKAASGKCVMTKPKKHSVNALRTKPSN